MIQLFIMCKRDPTYLETPMIFNTTTTDNSIHGKLTEFWVNKEMYFLHGELVEKC